MKKIVKSLALALIATAAVSCAGNQEKTDAKEENKQETPKTDDKQNDNKDQQDQTVTQDVIDLNDTEALGSN